MARVGRTDGLRYGGVVGLPAVLNAGLDFGHRKFALVDRHAVVGNAPDQAFAQMHLGIVFQRAGPGAVDQLGVDGAQRAVGIEVAAREVRLYPGRAQRRCKVVKLFHVGVFGAAQCGQVAGVVEIGRVAGAAVR